MPSIFSRIIAGEIPGTFVWRDDTCAAFLSINPTVEGHTLVVPRAEVDHWIDLDESALARVMEVSRIIGQAQQRVFACDRIGLLVAGFEVPHVHVHVLPMNSMAAFDLSQAHAADRDELATAAERMRGELRAAGHGDAVDSGG